MRSRLTIVVSYKCLEWDLVKHIPGQISVVVITDPSGLVEQCIPSYVEFPVAKMGSFNFVVRIRFPLNNFANVWF